MKITSLILSIGLLLTTSFAYAEEEKESKYIKKPIAENTVEYIKPFLKMWQPTNVSQSDSTLTITLPQVRVAEPMYNSVLKNGVCTSIWIGDKRWEGIEEINILNEYEAQGYIFEGGANECIELASKSGTSSEFFILGKTRMK